jgi:hypothetical protein
VSLCFRFYWNTIKRIILKELRPVFVDRSSTKECTRQPHPAP